VWSDAVINKKGVCLENHEIEILKMVHLHKIISVSLLNEMYLHYRPNANKKSISNRLAKLVERKVLYLKKHASAFNRISYSYFYVIGEVGMQLLKYINDPLQPVRTKTYEPNKVRIPNLHNYYAMESIQSLYIQNLKRESPYPFAIKRGAAHELFGIQTKLVSKQKGSPIVPDYVISLNDKIICFESDMGTERIQQIKQKEEMYCRLKQTEAFQNKRVYVVYSVVDEKRNVEAGDNNLLKARRIHSLKAAHSPATNWPESLEFFVVTSNELVEFILEFLLSPNGYPIPIPLKRASLGEIGRKLTGNYQRLNGWQVDELETGELLIDKRNTPLLPQATKTVRYRTLRGTVKTMVYVPGEFGSVRTYQETQTLSKLLTETNNTLFMQEYLPIEMVVGYLRTIDLTKEYFGFTPTLPIRLVNYEDEELRGLELISAFKKEWKGW